MLKDIIEAVPKPAHKLFLRFEDGLTGEVDVAAISNFVGIFAALRDESTFAQVRVNNELGTVQWPNGADLDPDVLHAMLSGAEVKFAA